MLSILEKEQRRIDPVSERIASLFSYFLNQYSIAKTPPLNLTILIESAGSNMFCYDVELFDLVLSKYNIKTLTIYLSSESLVVPDYGHNVFIHTFERKKLLEAINTTNPDFVVLDCPNIHINPGVLKNKWVDKCFHRSIAIYGFSSSVEMTYLESLYARVNGFVIADIKDESDVYPSPSPFKTSFNSAVPNTREFNKPGVCIWTLAGICTVNQKLLNLVNLSHHFISGLVAQISISSSPYELISHMDNNNSEWLLLNYQPKIGYSNHRKEIVDISNGYKIISNVKDPVLPFFPHQSKSIIKKQLMLGVLFDLYKVDIADYILQNYGPCNIPFDDEVEEFSYEDEVSETNTVTRWMSPYEKYIFAVIDSGDFKTLSEISLSGYFDNNGNNVLGSLILSGQHCFIKDAIDLDISPYHRNLEDLDCFDLCVISQYEDVFQQLFITLKNKAVCSDYWENIYTKAISKGLFKISSSIIDSKLLPNSYKKTEMELL